MVIDAHQHFWKYNPVSHSWIDDTMHVIQKDFFPEDLKPILDKNGFDGCVVVQVDQSEEENTFLLDLAGKYDFIKGVVGWVDLRSEKLDQHLQHWVSFPKLKGFRHIVQGEPAGFLRNARFADGVKKLHRFNFTYDLLIYHHQLDEAVEFVRHAGDTRIVIDHIAKPAIRNHDIKVWASHMRTLAAFPNVWCKVSGMVTEADWRNWRTADFIPYLTEVFDAFGAGRVIYGSDWPVCLVAASYEQQLGLVQKFISTLSSPEKQQVMGENAKTFYNL